jgi:hypothetical protein
MSAIRSSLLKGASALALTAGLAACSGGGGNNQMSVTTPPPPPTVDALAANFGTGFAADFRMASTATPPVPAAGDIVPLSLTTQPIPLSS